jgi:beta-galactosidase
MPSGKPVGYGEWGVIDAWRRPKPETFLVRNIYAPVKLVVPPPGAAWAPTLTVANRFDFSDLSEVAFSWTILGTGSSGAGAAAGGPHTDGLSLTLQGLPSPLSGVMQINATSARGFLVNSWQFPLSAADAAAVPPRARPARAAGAAPPQVVELPDGRLRIQDAASTFTWFVAPGDGTVSGNTSAGALLASGPGLMVLATNDEGGMQLTEDMPPITPFNDPLAGWALRSRTYATNADAVVVTLAGAFADAAGAFTLAFDGAARLTASYNFTWTAAGKTNPRQVGLVFGAAPALSYVSWRRATPWAAPYPADHIGRAAGDLVPANAGPEPGNVTRAGSWCNDPSPLGDADFRSTRHNVTVFELSDATRAAALAFVSDGASQHGRAWVAPGGVHLLAADLSNEGGNPFSREAVLPHEELTAGMAVVGAATLQLGSALS